MRFKYSLICHFMHGTKINLNSFLFENVSNIECNVPQFCHYFVPNIFFRVQSFLSQLTLLPSLSTPGFSPPIHFNDLNIFFSSLHPFHILHMYKQLLIKWYQIIFIPTKYETWKLLLPIYLKKSFFLKVNTNLHILTVYKCELTWKWWW